jgi:hypothetical protein
MQSTMANVPKWYYEYTCTMVLLVDSTSTMVPWYVHVYSYHGTYVRTYTCTNCTNLVHLSACIGVVRTRVRMAIDSTYRGISWYVWHTIGIRVPWYHGHGVYHCTLYVPNGTYVRVRTRVPLVPLVRVPSCYHGSMVPVLHQRSVVFEIML